MASSNAKSDQPRWIRMRFPGRCRLCGRDLRKGEKVLYEPANSTVRCLMCVPPSQKPVSTEPPPNYRKAPPTPGSAGASARREYERRRAMDAARQSPSAPERRSTRVWEVGAAGEEHLGQLLNGLVVEGILVLHDRRLKGKRANFDHIVLTRGRVWVVDAKRYRGEVNHKRTGWWGRNSETLFVGRRDVSDLVEGVKRQAAIVQGMIGRLPLSPALCFVDADWRGAATGFNLGTVAVVPPATLLRQLRATNSGPIDTFGLRNYLSVDLRPA